jgi:hypothetical protein
MVKGLDHELRGDVCESQSFPTRTPLLARDELK